MWPLTHNQVAGAWNEGGGTCVREKIEKGKGTIDAIFILRQLQEQYLENDEELYLVFVD